VLTATATAASHAPQVKGISADMRSLYADLKMLHPDFRRPVLHESSPADLEQLFKVALVEDGTAYGLWQDDPTGFIETVLGETMWSKQREVAEAVRDHKRVAVPAGFGVSKTHGAARLVAWRGSVYPAGTSLTVTTATRMRQVTRQLWPHVRMLVKKASLPGKADMYQWRAPDMYGVEQDVAYGFSAPANDESAVQGIHAPRLFIVVDEGGGIDRNIGKALRGLLTGEDTKMLVIGNPPTDDEGSWFETLCETPGVKVVRIAATDAPLLTGEKTQRCRACPPQVPAHPLGVHLVDQEWVDEAVREHGNDSPYVQAKVHARFPKGGSARAIPSSWVDAAVESPDEAWNLDVEDGYVPLGSLIDDPEDRDYGTSATGKTGI
jgi:hypothetical protein